MGGPQTPLSPKQSRAAGEQQGSATPMKSPSYADVMQSPLIPGVGDDRIIGSPPNVWDQSPGMVLNMHMGPVRTSGGAKHLLFPLLCVMSG